MQNGAATGVTGNTSGGATCSTGHLGEANSLVTGRAGQQRSAHVHAACMHMAQSRASGGDCSVDSEELDPAGGQDDGDKDCLVDTMEPPHDHEVVPGVVHYYVAICSSEESADPHGKANVEIGPGCHDHLQQELDHGDINTFLALPEIIPTRQRRHPQPLLDFTKSKILTSRTYTESYERLLAQKEATQAEAKWKADLTKETRRRKKAEHDLQVRARKEARNAKKEERLRSEVEKRLRGCGRGRSNGAPSTTGAPPESPHIAAALFPPPAVGTFGACSAFELPNPTGPPSSVLLAFRAPPLPQIPWAQEPFQPSPSFWNNPLLGMPHMFQHPLLSHHNGNSWVPQVSMPGAGDVRAAPNFQGARLLADEVATFGSDRHGVGMW